jgi:hypothetical protein
MTFVVAQRNPISSSKHPDPRYGTSLDDLAEFLDGRFDPDRVLNLPFESYVVEISADFARRSRCEYLKNQDRGRVTLNLQPAQDIAEMVLMFWESQVWPARIAFKMFKILRGILVARGLVAAGVFADDFVDQRLDQLITEYLFAEDDKSSLWANSQKMRYGRPDARALHEQLAVFQIFHELGHLIGWRTASLRGEQFSVDNEQNEVDCDHFACQEIGNAYGDDADLELLHSAPVSCFFTILIWTLAEHLGGAEGRLYLTDVRQRTFSAIVRRSKAATLHLHRYEHRFEPPSKRLEAEALHYFPVLEGLLNLLDVFFTEAVSTSSKMFEEYETDTDYILKHLYGHVGSDNAISSVTRSHPWEKKWLEEDAAAEERVRRSRTLEKEWRGRPRSRPMLGG